MSEPKISLAELCRLMGGYKCVHCGVITMSYSDGCMNRIADFGERINSDEEYLGNICVRCYYGFQHAIYRRPTGVRSVPMEDH